MKGVEIADEHLAQVQKHMGSKGDIAGIYGAVREATGISNEESLMLKYSCGKWNCIFDQSVRADEGDFPLAYRNKVCRVSHHEGTTHLLCSISSNEMMTSVD